MTFPIFQLPYLPPNTIVPTEKLEVTFVQYLMRLYEEIAFNVNARDYVFFTIPISDVAVDIPNLPNFGAFIVCVSGVESSQPAGVWALAKSNTNIAGTRSEIVTQDGTDAWNTKGLLITTNKTNFQIRHDRTGITANFNVRIIKTL